ncbi:hypothetical protein HMPREF1554_01850 [Porphyromonas gingivalis F0569]|nr:hypothetical protein HMPREF1554_01850 [Porphyromonas gingivalis F0569]
MQAFGFFVRMRTGVCLMMLRKEIWVSETDTPKDFPMEALQRL